MAGLMQTVVQNYNYLMESKADSRTKHWFFVSSPFPVILLCVLYLLFVNKWGPRFMKNRKPFKIDGLMMVYNVFQILANLTWVIVSTIYILPAYNIHCTPIDYSRSPVAMMSLRLGYAYFFIKISDLLDTVFFVLRKKQEQASFLHVYHHCVMVFTSWFGLRFVPGGQAFFIPFMNTIVHVFMYLYYFMTSMDEKYKKSVWWKKHITQLQLLQFLILQVMFTRVLLDEECNFPKSAIMAYLPQNILFLYLFGNFYWNAYVKPKSKTDLSKENKGNL